VKVAFVADTDQSTLLGVGLADGVMNWQQTVNTSY